MQLRKRWQKVLQATKGNDKIWGYEGNWELHAGAGNDTVYGASGQNILYGDAGDDNLYGQSQNDQLYGGDGDDYIHGGDGDDWIVGGLGNDYMVGGAGVDTYYFKGTWGSDSVYTGDPSAIVSKDKVIIEGVMPGFLGDLSTLSLGRDGASLLILNKRVQGGGYDKIQIVSYFTSERFQPDIFINGELIKYQFIVDYLNGELGPYPSARSISAQPQSSSGTFIPNVDSLVSAMASFAPPAAGEIGQSVMQQPLPMAPMLSVQG